MSSTPKSIFSWLSNSRYFFGTKLFSLSRRPMRRSRPTSPVLISACTASRLSAIDSPKLLARLANSTCFSLNASPKLAAITSLILLASSSEAPPAFHVSALVTRSNSVTSPRLTLLLSSLLSLRIVASTVLRCSGLSLFSGSMILAIPFPMLFKCDFSLSEKSSSLMAAVLDLSLTNCPREKSYESGTTAGLPVAITAVL